MFVFASILKENNAELLFPQFANTTKTSHYVSPGFVVEMAMSKMLNFGCNTKIKRSIFNLQNMALVLECLRHILFVSRNYIYI
jgi:hypothetical protein